MSPENNGVPEDDDPFAYLYRGEGGDGAAVQESAPQPGVPRTSYHNATQVGRTQYGQRPQQQAPPVPQQQQGYPPQGSPQLPPQEQPTAQYQAPGAYQQPSTYPPGYQPQQSQQYPPTQQYQAPPPGGGRAGARAGASGRRGGRGVMYGTIAVGVVVVLGIVIALVSNNTDKNTTAGAGSSTAAAAVPTGGTVSSTASAGASEAPLPPPVDADKLVLAGGAAVAHDHTGAVSADGGFVPLTAQGASITWTVTAPKKGQYTFWVHYANAGADSAATVTINGKAAGSAIKLANFTKATDWDKAWQSSYVFVNLKSGSNTIVLSVSGANQGNVNVDALAVTKDASTRPWS